MICNHDVRWNYLKKLQPWKMFSFCYWKSGGTFRTLCACFDKLFWGEQLCGGKSGRFYFWWEIKIFTRATSIFVSRNKWLNGCFRMLPQLRLLAAPIKEIKQKEENVTKYQLSTSQNPKMSTQYYHIKIYFHNSYSNLYQLVFLQFKKTLSSSWDIETADLNKMTIARMITPKTTNFVVAEVIFFSFCTKIQRAPKIYTGINLCVS